MVDMAKEDMESTEAQPLRSGHIRYDPPFLVDAREIHAGQLEAIGAAGVPEAFRVVWNRQNDWKVPASEFDFLDDDMFRRVIEDDSRMTMED